MAEATAPSKHPANRFKRWLLENRVEEVGGRESKEGQEQLRTFQRIPVRKDVEPDPPRLFRGFKYVIENPEDYKDFDATVKEYLEIFKLR